MPAYIIVEVDVHNPVEYENYKKLTPASLQPFNGKFIVRGGNAVLLEGRDEPKRMVVLEFPTKELAKDWWSSEAYAPAKALRHKTATTRMILVEGTAQPDSAHRGSI